MENVLKGGPRNDSCDWKYGVRELYSRTYISAWGASSIAIGKFWYLGLLKYQIDILWLGI